MDSVLDHAPVGVGIVGLDGRFLKVNNQLAAELRRSAGALERLRFQDITDLRDLDPDMENVERLLRGDADSYSMEKRFCDGADEPFWTQLRVSLVRGSSGAPLHFLSVVEDISLRKAQEQDMLNLALRDPLTGLPNRHWFDREAEALFRRWRQEGCSGAVTVVDVNGLKEVNDRWGHAAGDTVIAQAGQRLAAAVRKHGIAARLGGDEFVLLLKTHLQQFGAVLRWLLGRPVPWQGVQLPCSISAGSAVPGADGGTLAQLMAAADARMYEDKRQFYARFPEGVRLPRCGAPQAAAQPVHGR